MKNNTEYQIIDADKNMIDRVSEMFWNNPKLKEQRYDYRFKVAVNAEGEILGYLDIADRTYNMAPELRYRLFLHLRVVDGYRRRGIATALVTDAINQAVSDGVKYVVGSVDPGEAAHGFWNSMNACFFRYGQPDENGNYHHCFCISSDNAPPFAKLPNGFTSALSDDAETTLMLKTVLREKATEY